MARFLSLVFLALLLFPALLFAAEGAAAPRPETIETIATLTFTPGSSYRLTKAEYVNIGIILPESNKPGVQRLDAEGAKSITLTLRVAESKDLVRQLEGLTGKRVLVKGPGVPSADAVTHDIQANSPEFSITEAPSSAKPPGTCDAVEDCRAACKGAGKGSECEPDGEPYCKDHQCGCELNCL